jgi:hypothetical protein
MDTFLKGVFPMNDYEFENLVIAIESCFKQNYCALYFKEIVEKFSPEIDERELETAIRAMDRMGKIKTEGTLMRLIVR